MNPIAIGSDHGGYQLKALLVKSLQEWGLEVQDLGTHSSESCDYPDIAHALARGIEQGRFDIGLLVCGTGVGMSIAANRHAAVRAAVVSDPFTARMAREHNHSNVLCLGERVVGQGLALAIVRAWLDARPDTDPRHSRRVAKLNPGEPRT
jgi:ribose 5-phosphate isomerase B